MTVGIFGSKYQAERLLQIRQVFDKLQALETKVFIDAGFYSFLSKQLAYNPPVDGLLTDDEPYSVDVALSIGGDGTFLHTAAKIGKLGIPIIGINTGRLGFLADITADEISNALEQLVQGNYSIEERSVIELVSVGNVPNGKRYALNEVAVLKQDTSSMITVHAFLNKEYLSSYQADGLIVATPTGSTAYSMSVNGPIILPQCNNFVLSPVAPHSLNVRPLVIPDNFTIDMSIESRNQTFLVSLDGNSEIYPVGTNLTVRKANFTVKVIKRLDHTFYQTLRDKLMWGADKRMS